MANFRYITTRAGIAKIVTIILGILCLGLTIHSHDREWKEEVFLGIIITCLAVSIILLSIFLLVTDSDSSTSAKAGDFGFHFIAALLLIVGGSLMIYSAVQLRNHWRYFCSFGFDRGIPCIYDRYRDNYFNGRNSIQQQGGYYDPSASLSYGTGIGIGTGAGYGSSSSSSYGSYGYGGGATYADPNYGGGYSSGRSFFKPSWVFGLLSSLKGVNIYEECLYILPRAIQCNEYFELKLASGILGIINAIMYAVTGFMILLAPRNDAIDVIT